MTNLILFLAITIIFLLLLLIRNQIVILRQEITKQKDEIVRLEELMSNPNAFKQSEPIEKKWEGLRQAFSVPLGKDNRDRSRS